MRPIAVVLWLGACSFAGSAAEPDDGGDSVTPDASSTDAPAPDLDAAVTPDSLTCGDLACSPDATCNPDTVSCVCNAGYEGDGVTCTDNDECADASAGCPALCVNEVGGFRCEVPGTCAERKAVDPEAVADGDYTLWLGGDQTRPVTIYCHDMASSPVEYLSVSDTFSQYSEGAASVGSDVRTSYSRVRLRMQPLGIAISDRTFAASTGQLDHASSGTIVTSMPVGVAMDCGGTGSAEGVARLGVPAPFTITQGFAKGGQSPGGEATLTDGGRTIVLTGGGRCGWHGPNAGLFNPFNDNTGGVFLTLSYAP